MNSVTVSFPDGSRRDVPHDTPLSELLSDETEDPTNPVVAAVVNNEVLDLSRRVRINGSIRPVRLASDAGIRCYRQSLCFLLSMATRSFYNGRRLVIGHSLGHGYYYYFDDNEEVDSGDLQKLSGEMRKLVEEDLPIRRRLIAYDDAIALFEAAGMSDTVALLEHRNSSRVTIHECGSFSDISHGPLVPSTALLKHFELTPLSPGFVLRFPPRRAPTTIAKYRHSPLLFSIYQEYKQWGKILGVTSAGTLNRKSRDGTIGEFIRINEALHDRKIAAIAGQIADRKEVRAVLVAGPSSSGKTTFAKRLALQLQAQGITPLPLSADDYFVSRDRTPLDEEGNPDFESIHALDIELLNQHLLDLCAGKPVEIPSFNFRSGSRRRSGKRLTMGEHSILLMEGIHCLNDALTPRISADTKFKVYVSALTQLNLDDHNRIPTTDNRLLRRLVRDHKYRGHSALDTLGMWPSVRRGEERNIFPYQDTADAAFNSALDYEVAILKKHAEPLLQIVKPHHEVYDEAVRMLSFLADFANIPDKPVPGFSILREFIGDSGFHY
jgi:uridine kinase